jgi:hypothetical protein
LGSGVNLSDKPVAGGLPEDGQMGQRLLGERRDAHLLPLMAECRNKGR